MSTTYEGSNDTRDVFVALENFVRTIAEDQAARTVAVQLTNQPKMTEAEFGRLAEQAMDNGHLCSIGDRMREIAEQVVQDQDMPNESWVRDLVSDELSNYPDEDRVEDMIANQIGDIDAEELVGDILDERFRRFKDEITEELSSTAWDDPPVCKIVDRLEPFIKTIVAESIQKVVFTVTAAVKEASDE